MAKIKIQASYRILANDQERAAEARKNFFTTLSKIVSSDKSCIPVKMNSYRGIDGSCYEITLPDNWIESFANAGYWVAKSDDYYTICKDRNDLVSCANTAYVWPEANMMVYSEGVA